MFEVTVEDTFAAGHFLRNYKGKCENPHGHNYKIRVTLAGAELDTQAFCWISKTCAKSCAMSSSVSITR